jgi:hypothetical protein
MTFGRNSAENPEKCSLKPAPKFASYCLELGEFFPSTKISFL